MPSIYPAVYPRLVYNLPQCGSYEQSRHVWCTSHLQDTQFTIRHGFFGNLCADLVGYVRVHFKSRRSNDRMTKCTRNCVTIIPPLQDNYGTAFHIYFVAGSSGVCMSERLGPVASTYAPTSLTKQSRETRYGRLPASSIRS